MIRRALSQLLCLLLLALIPAAVSGFIQLKWRGPQEELQPGEVHAGTAKMWGDKVLWVDARERKKYDAGHIAGAVLLNEDEWEQCIPAFLDAWDPAKTIVVYCDGGKCDASHVVAARLRGELQLESVYVLKGGWQAWQEE